jgi:anti-sigma28 factor (negative regulator of flagellin synthesis)
MRTERSARRARGSETTGEEGSAGSQTETKTGGCEPNQFSPEQGSSGHGPAEWARASRWAAQASPPEVRGERIAAIQKALAEGSYQVSPEQTADAIISEQQVRDGTAA